MNKKTYGLEISNHEYKMWLDLWKPVLWPTTTDLSFITSTKLTIKFYYQSHRSLTGLLLLGVYLKLSGKPLSGLGA